MMLYRYRVWWVRALDWLLRDTVVYVFCALLCCGVGGWYYWLYYPQQHAYQALVVQRKNYEQVLNQTDSAMTLQPLSATHQQLLALCNSDTCILEEHDRVDEERHGYTVCRCTLRCMTTYAYLITMFEHIEVMVGVVVESVRVEPSDNGIRVIMALQIYGA